MFFFFRFFRKENNGKKSVCELGKTECMVRCDLWGNDSYDLCE